MSTYDKAGKLLMSTKIEKGENLIRDNLQGRRLRSQDDQNKWI